MKFYEWGTLIVCALFAAFLLFHCNCFRANNDQVIPIKISLEIPQDTINYDLHAKQYQVLCDSVLNQINRQEVDLDRHYEMFVKSAENDADIIKVITIVCGLFIAILSIFGIKNWKNIEEKIERNACDVANEAVNKTVNLEVNKKIKETVDENQYVVDLKNSIIDEVRKSIIINIDNRLSDLESKFGNDEGGNENKIKNDTQSISTESNKQEDINLDFDVPTPGE